MSHRVLVGAQCILEHDTDDTAVDIDQRGLAHDMTNVDNVAALFFELLGQLGIQFQSRFVLILLFLFLTQSIA